MLLSLDWLREFVPFEGDAGQLGDRLTMLGLEMEGVLRPFEAIENIVVGHVVTCEQHPDADKLRVCTVDVGGPEVLNIVCGAPNVRSGLKVPVAMIGTVMPEGFKISKAKLRGVLSEGMICSERELQLSDEHQGIMELPENLTPGIKLVDALGLDKEVCEIGITPNRGDCLSVLGLAREVALGFNLPLKMPEVALHEEGDDAAAEISVQVANPADCPVYYGRIIEGVKVGPSSPKVRYRLLASGVRPISNVVDVTNYIMLELGQPLHSFDLQNLQGGKIAVQRAEKGMSFTTLDNQARILQDSDLMIWDAVKPVALAGVMGGQNSEIKDASTRVFLESAVFAPSLVRRTARRLALGSESSYRFERGVNQGLTLFALNRASALIASAAGGTVRRGVCGAEFKPFEPRRIPFCASRASSLLGINLERSFCEETLRNLGCSLDSSLGSSLEEAAVNETMSGGALASACKPDFEALPPSWRNDLTHEADLIEEVGRVYGLDRIEPTLPKVSRSLQQDVAGLSEFDFLTHLKRWGAGLGLNEVINYSFVGHKDLDLLNLPTEGRISIKNPLSAEQDVLRTELGPGLLNTLRHNLAQGAGQGASGIRVFELARSFNACAKQETGAAEQGRLAIMLYGARHDGYWPQVEADADYQDIKGLVEHLLRFLHLPAAQYNLASSHNWLLPCVEVLLEGKVLGLIGRVNPEIADACHARKPVWFADLNSDMLLDLYSRSQVLFKPLPQFPPVRRDITLICPQNLTVDAVLQELAKIKMPLLQGTELLDVFVPEGGAERNLTFRFTFRHDSRTLKDTEVDKERTKLAEFLVKSLPVRV